MPCKGPEIGVCFHCNLCEKDLVQVPSAASAGSSQEEIIDRLRGQLQNCVNHLERARRHYPSGGYDAAIDSANKALYETLMR